MTSHQAQAGRQATRDDSYKNNKRRKNQKTRLGREGSGELEGDEEERERGGKPGGH